MTQDSVTPDSLAALTADLVFCRKDYEDALAAENRATTARLNALRAVNNVQLKIDAAVRTLVESAPTGSDWQRRLSKRRINSGGGET